MVGRAVIGWARPQFVILATTGSLGRAAAAALVMGLVAAIVPARRLARLEPAAAYRGMMTGRIPSPTQNLFQDRRRRLLAVGGVAASLVLVLVLDGVFAGAMQQVNAYMRNSPADVFVAQRRPHHAHDPICPPARHRRRRRRRRRGGLGRRAALHDQHPRSGRRRAAHHLRPRLRHHHRPRRTSQPRRRPSAGPGEVLVDDTAADELGVQVGDTVSILGSPVPLRSAACPPTAPTSSTPPSTSAPRTSPPSEATPSPTSSPAPNRGRPRHPRPAHRAALPDTTVQTRAEFARQEANVVRDMAADVMKIVTVIGFVIALAVTGLTLFTATLAKLREYGILKALGAGTPRLAATVAAQAAWSVTLALAAAVAVSMLLGAAIGAATPNVEVAIEPASVLRTGATALIVGALASLIPLRRVLRVDPATAFRRPDHDHHRHRHDPPVTAISVRHLTKTFGEATSPSTPSTTSTSTSTGEVVLVMGPSGSGKTTLLLMLGAMLRPPAARSSSTASTSPPRPSAGSRAASHHLGFIFQDFNLLSALTARENVELACNLAGTVGRDAHHRATDLLGRVGLSERLDFRPDQLSGGRSSASPSPAPCQQPHRPAGRRTHRQPRLRPRTEIARLLRRLAEEDGRSIVIVSHDDRLRQVADRSSGSRTALP